MLVDYEAAWLSLAEVVGQKSHHGQRDLLAEMSRLAVAHRVEEGLPEKALRLYGVELGFDLTRIESPSEAPRVGRQDDSEARPPVATHSHESQGADHGSSNGSRLAEVG